MAAPKPDPRRAALLAIFDLLSPRGKARADLALAFDEPDAYAERFAKALAERRMSRATKNLPWIALVDALARERRLASIDHKTSMEDLRWSLDALASLPKRAARWAWVKEREDELDERSTLELLEIVGERLAADDGLVLAQLDIGADEHELVLVPEKDARRLVELGKKAKYSDVDLFTGSDLARFESEREAAARATAAREQEDPDVQRQFVHPDGRVWITYGRRWGAGDERCYALEIVTGRLGHEAHSRGENETRTTGDPKELARWRAGELAARVVEGFEEISRAEYVAKEAAAARALRKARGGKAAPSPKAKRRRG